MTSFQWAIDTAHRLIEAKGRTVTLAQKNVTAYDPTTDVETSTAPAHSTKAVVQAPSKQQMEGRSLVLASTRSLLMAAKNLTIVPEPGDTATFDGQDWVIIDVTHTSPDGSDIIYEALVER